MDYKQFESLEAVEGQTLVLFGMTGKIKTRMYQAIYPYKHTVLDAWFVPDESNANYAEEKTKLGDNWVICLRNDESLHYVLGQIAPVTATN